MSGRRQCPNRCQPTWAADISPLTLWHGTPAGRGSLYRSKSPRERMMIDKFLERTLAHNARMVDAVNQYGFILVDVMQSNVTELAERCISALDTDER